MRRTTRSTVAGRNYLDLQNLARRTAESTEELLTRFVLERFLYRLAQSPHRQRLILKGGMLLEVFDVRRPTRDIDFLGRSITNDADEPGHRAPRVSPPPSMRLLALVEAAPLAILDLGPSPTRRRWRGGPTAPRCLVPPPVRGQLPV